MNDQEKILAFASGFVLGIMVMPLGWLFLRAVAGVP